jgi:2-succinyl-6-hydroxy-2,4-cyclohexadiene-1-carboxylate synthase
LASTPLLPKKHLPGGLKAVRVNGVNYNVRLVGSGPAVVALHGFAGNMSTWAEFVREARRKYTVVRVDLLGHGGSDAPRAVERYRMERAVRDIATVIRRLGFPQACWLGYSMGGRMALAAAALTPRACNGLVLEGASPGLSSPTARARRRRKDEALARFILEEGVEAFTNYWAERPLFNTQKSLPLRVQDRIRRQRLKSNPIGLANNLRAAGPGTQPAMHKSLSTLQLPVLCIAGERDRKFTMIARNMSKKLRNGRLVVIPGAGHAAHLEKPRDFNKAVLAFLDESLT